MAENNAKDLTAIAQRWEYYNGSNHRATWIGVKSDLATATGKRNEDAIDRLLQSADVLKSVVDFHVAALLGESAVVSDELGQTIYDSWRGSTSITGASDVITEAVTRAKATGYGYLRLMVLPNGEALIHSPAPESVEVARDDNDQIKSIAYTFLQDGRSLIERQEIGIDGLTQFQILDGEETVALFKLDLGGKFSIQELRMKNLVTESAQRNQDGITQALTMVPRGIELSGFLARFFTNSRPPGEWVTSPDGTTEFKPDQDGLVIGAGIVNFISGLPILDAAGNVTNYTSVGVHSDPPLPINSFVDAFNLFSGIIYLQASQAHRLGYAIALSGRSREELRGDFRVELMKDKAPLERVLRRCLMVAIALQGIKLDGDLMVTLKPNAGALTREEKVFILDCWKEGLLEKTEARSLLGFEA